MLKRLSIITLSLCMLYGTNFAAEPVAKQAQREQKALEKAQRKKVRQEARNFESLRNDAVVQFARAHQPASIQTPSGLLNDIRVSNVICAGDNISGTVMVYMDVTPMLGTFRLFMGGERNGTCAIAKGVAYPASDHYGRVYTLRSGQPEQIILTFYNIAPGVERLDRVDVSMGLALATLNIITLREAPIYWTYSDNAIRNYVEQKTAPEAN